MHIEQAHRGVTFAYLPKEPCAITKLTFSPGLSLRQDVHFSLEVHWDRRERKWWVFLRASESYSAVLRRLGSVHYPYTLVDRHADVRCDLRLLTSMGSDADVLRENLAPHFGYHATKLAAVRCQLEPDTPYIRLLVVVHNRPERKKFIGTCAFEWHDAYRYFLPPKKYRELERFADPLKKKQ